MLAKVAGELLEDFNLKCSQGLLGNFNLPATTDETLDDFNVKQTLKVDEEILIFGMQRSYY